MPTELEPVREDRRLRERWIKWYHLPENYEEAELTLSTANDAYTAEWETQSDVYNFVSSLSEYMPNIEDRYAVATFRPTGKHNSQLETKLGKITSNEHYPNNCERLKVEAGSYEITWEHWESGNTLSLESRAYDAEILQNIFQDTASEEVSSETIERILDGATSVIENYR